MINEALRSSWTHSNERLLGNLNCWTRTRRSRWRLFQREIDYMYCPECGKEVADVSKFCMHCGFSLTGADSKPPPQKSLAINSEPPTSIGQVELYMEGNSSIKRSWTGTWITRDVAVWFSLFDSCNRQTTASGSLLVIVSFQEEPWGAEYLAKAIRKSRIVYEDNFSADDFFVSSSDNLGNDRLYAQIWGNFGRRSTFLQAHSLSCLLVIIRIF